MALTADELTAIRVTLTAARLFNQPMPDQAAWRYLEEAGVDLNAICDLANPIVCTNGSIDDGSFTFDPLGEAFLVTSVLGEDAETTVDFVGWSAREPEKFGSMYRTCGVLGIDQLLNPATYVDGAPCLIWRTPLNWLRAGCKGAVILDADMAKNPLRAAPGLLAAETLEHARQLVAAGLLPKSRLVVPVPDGRAA